LKIRAGLLAACTATACARNPATGARQLSLISESREIQMGREYDQEVRSSLGLYPDSALQRYVQELGARLAARSERPNLPWTFHVVDDPVVNAFALPGGFIFVTRGILGHLRSEAQLAAVVGHEIGHVTARHTVNQLSKQQLAQVGLTVGSIVSPEFERFGGLASAALGVLFLKYSRDHESQADELGLRYMRRGGYDPREMPDVFTLLDRVSQGSGGGRVPEWLATHPAPANRRERIVQLIAALPRDSSGTTVSREPYLRRLDGLVFGTNPRDGYFKGAQFFHPELKFRLTFPEGWTTSNQPQAVLAVSPRKDAVVEVGLAKQPTADQAARAFFSERGVTADWPRQGTLNGLPSVSGAFAAAAEGATLRGTAVFVEHGGAVYRLLAYSSEERWPAYQAPAERALGSFARLTDRAALNVQPQRIAIVKLDRGATLAELARTRPSPVPVATLALINQVEPDTPLAAGETVKWIVGDPLP